VHQVVILGGGFGGLSAARALRRARAEVTLVDRCNYHLFQPLLYQVATGALSPANIAAPLRGVLKRQKNAKVLLGEAVDIDVEGRRVILSDGEVSYDTLIVATGSRHQYFGHEQWEECAPGLKTIEDATHMRARILLAFEAAERETNKEKLRAWLTFVIVGAGPTGVELAGALGEISKDTLKNDFRNIDTAEAKILLIEGADRVLTTYPAELSAAGQRMLERLGVTVRTSTMVTEVTPESVTLRSGDGSEVVPTRTVLWAAGIQASPLGRILAEKAGATLDRVGRIGVEPNLSVARHPEIFVIGDLASFSHQTGKPLPGVAQVAMQQGQYAARLIEKRIKEGPEPRAAGQRHGVERPFHYVDKGNMATIGRKAAVADLHGLRVAGFPAWLIWLFIHLLYIVEFESRLLVMLQWAWNYFTFNRAARLITGKNPLPLDL
jgi:NADH dehydrogenase